jgi:hypothetical protein
MAGVDDIGLHLLDPQKPLLARSSPAVAPPQERKEIAIDPQVADRYTGRYQLAPAVTLTVTREGGRLFVQLTGQPKLEIFAESDKNCFPKIVDAQLTFETGTSGKAVAVVLHQNGRDQRAPRIEGEPVEPEVVALEPRLFDRFVGRYQFAPGMLFTIRREESRFFAQLTGQPEAEIFPSDERNFFYKVVNARLTFELDSENHASAVVLHQFGRDTKAMRVD